MTLYTATDGREKCSYCERRIPQDVERIGFYYRNAYGRPQSKRVCARCILLLASKINKKPVRDWNDRIIVKEKL